MKEWTGRSGTSDQYYGAALARHTFSGVSAARATGSRKLDTCPARSAARSPGASAAPGLPVSQTITYVAPSPRSIASAPAAATRRMSWVAMIWRLKLETCPDSGTGLIGLLWARRRIPSPCAGAGLQRIRRQPRALTPVLCCPTLSRGSARHRVLRGAPARQPGDRRLRRRPSGRLVRRAGGELSSSHPPNSRASAEA